MLQSFYDRSMVQTVMGQFWKVIILSNLDLAFKEQKLRKFEESIATLH